VNGKRTSVGLLVGHLGRLTPTRVGLFVFSSQVANLILRFEAEKPIAIKALQNTERSAAW
jgi:hypothetical protein